MTKWLGYSRGYLAVHWITDICGGLISGCPPPYLFITAVRRTAGPAPAAATAAVRTSVRASAGGAHARRSTRLEGVNSRSWVARPAQASGGE